MTAILSGRWGVGVVVVVVVVVVVGGGGGGGGGDELSPHNQRGPGRGQPQSPKGKPWDSTGS